MEENCRHDKEYGFNNFQALVEENCRHDEEYGRKELPVLREENCRHDKNMDAITSEALEELS